MRLKIIPRFFRCLAISLLPALAVSHGCQKHEPTDQGKTADELHIQDALGRLDSKDPEVRGWASIWLRHFQPNDRRATAALVEALGGASVAGRREILAALSNIAADSQEAVPELKQALYDKDAIVRCRAIEALSRVKFDKAKAIALLEKELERLDLSSPEFDESGELKRRADWVIRGEAASVLWRLERSRRAAEALCDVGAATGDPQMLLTLHRGAPDSIRFLVERLQAEHPKERLASIYVLAILGPDAKSAESRLIAALEDDDVGIRYFAAEALGRITAESDEAASALVHRFEAGSQEEQFVAAKSLARMQRHRPAVVVLLARMLKDSVAGARRTACYALGQLGPVAVGAATDLNAALADDDESVRDAAVTALARLGPDAIPTLVEALGDRNPVRREGALDALQHVTGDRSIAVPRVVELLDDGDPHVAATATFVLAELNAVDGASDALIRLIRNSKNPGVRQSAVWALRKANRDAEQVVSALIAALSDSDSAVASLAIDGLNELGPRASAAESAILPICRDDSSFLYASAVTALGSFRSPSAMVSLTEFLQHHKNPLVRLNAALELAKFGAPARSVLIGALADSNPQVQIAVIRAIYDIDGHCDHVDQLVDFLQHPDFDPVNGSLTSLMAALALEHIGADARAAVPVLRQMTDLYDLSLSLAAIKALWKITGSKDEVLPAYFNLLAIGDAHVRRGVADALGSMGPAAASAKSRLVLLLEDDEGFVRTAAMRALANLESAMP